MARRPDVRVRRPGAGAEGAHGATVMVRIAVRTRSFESNPIENSTPRWQVVGQPVAGACRVERTSTAPPKRGPAGTPLVFAFGALEPTTKEKAGCWTGRRVFAQVRQGSNIQLLPFSLVTTSPSNYGDKLRLFASVPCALDSA